MLFAITLINKMRAAHDELCEALFADNRHFCELHKVKNNGTIMCKYPERINYTDEDNCTYKDCPLIIR